ncbi:MAG: 30S ribosomal protein S5 [Candidatus Woesearchaeota archaeon]
MKKKEVLKEEPVESIEIKEEGEEEVLGEVKVISENLAAWKPKTELGRKVKNQEIKNIDEILSQGLKIMEPEIVDMLLPNLKVDFLMIGQSKGKFGGGKRKIFRQVQKKTSEGNKPSFAVYAVIGNEDGYVGVGYGKARETVPAREKAIIDAKKNIMKIRRGCGSWECGCKTNHSIPFKVQGKSGSVVVTLIPAPKGAGLMVTSPAAKILKLAGISDVWSRSDGQTRTTINLIKACIDALKKLSGTKIME